MKKAHKPSCLVGMSLLWIAIGLITTITDIQIMIEIKVASFMFSYFLESHIEWYLSIDIATNVQTLTPTETALFEDKLN